jgi:DNA modification methylase
MSDYILIEKEEKYVDIINKRINEELNPPITDVKIKKFKKIKFANPELIAEVV